jgi:hypothetical protein
MKKEPATLLICLFLFALPMAPLFLLLGEAFFPLHLLRFLLFRMFLNSPCNFYLRVKSLIMVVA